MTIRTVEKTSLRFVYRTFQTHRTPALPPSVSCALPHFHALYLSLCLPSSRPLFADFCFRVLLLLHSAPVHDLVRFALRFGRWIWGGGGEYRDSLPRRNFSTETRFHSTQNFRWYPILLVRMHLENISN